MVITYDDRLFTLHISGCYNLVPLIFGTTIPTSFNILVKCFLHFITSAWWNVYPLFKNTFQNTYFKTHISKHISKHIFQNIYFKPHISHISKHILF